MDELLLVGLETSPGAVHGAQSMGIVQLRPMQVSPSHFPDQSQLYLNKHSKERMRSFFFGSMIRNEPGSASKEQSVVTLIARFYSVRYPGAFFDFSSFTSLPKL
jgi:hypothetical protein